jgi:hypothetical protein
MTFINSYGSVVINNTTAVDFKDTDKQLLLCNRMTDIQSRRETRPVQFYFHFLPQLQQIQYPSERICQ